MSKKEKPSKKAVRQKKEKLVDDATFGLKNKNKSSKVQQFINRVEKSVKNSSGGADQVCVFEPDSGMITTPSAYDQIVL